MLPPERVRWKRRVSREEQLRAKGNQINDANCQFALHHAGKAMNSESERWTLEERRRALNAFFESEEGRRFLDVFSRGCAAEEDREVFLRDAERRLRSENEEANRWWQSLRALVKSAPERDLALTESLAQDGIDVEDLYECLPDGFDPLALLRAVGLAHNIQTGWPSRFPPREDLRLIALTLLPLIEYPCAIDRQPAERRRAAGIGGNSGRGSGQKPAAKRPKFFDNSRFVNETQQVRCGLAASKTRRHGQSGFALGRKRGNETPCWARRPGIGSEGRRCSEPRQSGRRMDERRRELPVGESQQRHARQPQRRARFPPREHNATASGASFTDGARVHQVLSMCPAIPRWPTVSQTTTPRGVW